MALAMWAAMVSVAPAATPTSPALKLGVSHCPITDLQNARANIGPTSIRIGIGQLDTIFSGDGQSAGTRDDRTDHTISKRGVTILTVLIGPDDPLGGAEVDRSGSGSILANFTGAIELDSAAGDR